MFTCVLHALLTYVTIHLRMCDTTRSHWHAACHAIAMYVCSFFAERNLYITGLFCEKTAAYYGALLRQDAIVQGSFAERTLYYRARSHAAHSSRLLYSVEMRILNLRSSVCALALALAHTCTHARTHAHTCAE